MLLNSANEVIDALGGTMVTSVLLGVSKSTVSTWRKRGIPSGYFLRVSATLAIHGKLAAATAFVGMKTASATVDMPL